MKPTAHIAKPVVASKIGRFVALRGLRRVPGSGASSRGLAVMSFMARSLVSLCVLAALFAFTTAGVAQAEAPRLISDGSFPATLPEGVAVDNSSGTSSGDVYVAALFSSEINKFDASGSSLISPPSPFGEGGFSGAAINPTNGDVYVLTDLPNEHGNVEIDTFDPNTGALVGTPLEVPASSNLSGFFTVVQIGVDAVGDVYVPVAPQNEVLEYSESKTEPGKWEVIKTFTGDASAGALKGPTGVAVDSAGNLWVADTGNNRIEELSPADTQLAQIKSEGVQDGIALDGHGDVLAIDKNGVDFCGSVENAPPCSHLVEYNSTGVQIADAGAGSFETGPGPQLPPMVAVSQAKDLVYVSDAKGEKVWIFALPTAPRVENELSAEVTTSEAKLGALINPGGIETSYRFEYGTTTAYGQSVPFPEGSVGEGLTSHTVWAAASGLAPGTTYHYRVVATNELSPAGVVGEDHTFTTESAAQAACPNEQFRGGFSGVLPDCRAYELVTPATKTSVQIEGGAPSAEGNAFTFLTHESLPGAPTGGNSYVATRGSGGWSSEDMIPLESYSSASCDSHSNVVEGFSDDMSRALLGFGGGSRATDTGAVEAQGCNSEGLQVVPGEPVGYENLLLRDNATGAFRLVNAPESGLSPVPADAHFRGASADLSHVVFSEFAALTRDALAPVLGGVEDLYEWDEGALRLLTVLPGEVPAQGSLAQPPSGVSVLETRSPAMSVDGSHILFTSGGALYVRIDGERTIQVDKKQGGPGPSGGGAFQALSSDGSTVLFTDENQLTPGSTAAAGQPDLYECVLPEGASSCELTDLTVAEAGEHADVQYVSAFGSQDSSHVYFVAKGVLAEDAQSGQENLYVWDGSTTRLIATLSGGEDGAGAGVSPDGTWFAFDSDKSLTGYDNTLPKVGAAKAGAAEEIFLYSVGSGQVVCASCNPSGEVPIGGGGARVAASALRPLSDGGRVFFDTNEALVPSDTNNQMDVYEYEDGGQSLISSGTSPRASTFQGASESGDDAFFQSRQQLVPQDDTGEEARVIYDAHVGGGFPAPAAPSPCTTADACRVPVAPLPSVFGAPASATFSGAGNLAPPPAAPAVKPKAKALTCKKDFVKKKVKSKSRCVRKPTRKARKAAHTKKRGH